MYKIIFLTQTITKLSSLNSKKEIQKLSKAKDKQGKSSVINFSGNNPDYRTLYWPMLLQTPSQRSHVTDHHPKPQYWAANVLL